MDIWLILDMNYLCYRAFHVMGRLSHGEVRTGVLYGIFKDIVALKKFYETDKLIFCFDYGQPKRRLQCDTYKSGRLKKRQEMTRKEQRERQEFLAQVDELRTTLLKELGYRNIFFQKGYEADDFIAQAVGALPEKSKKVIVSADHDLFQLLGPRVSMWSPSQKKLYTYQSFFREFDITPDLWPQVKALAGCASDEIPGIAGVGEKTAAKYLADKLKPTSNAYKLIKTACRMGVLQKNLPLVLLPFQGTKSIAIRNDRCTTKKWRAVMERFGMESLLTSGGERKFRSRK